MTILKRLWCWIKNNWELVFLSILAFQFTYFYVQLFRGKL